MKRQFFIILFSIVLVISQFSTASPNVGGNFCGDWDGTYSGVLEHILSGKKQFLQLELFTKLIPVSGPSTMACELGGVASLVFGSDKDGSERLVSSLELTEFIPKDRTQVLIGKKGDFIVELTLESSTTDPGHISGNWYSKLFGFVGSFDAHTVISNQSIPVSSTVLGVDGLYSLSANRQWQMDLSTQPREPNPEEHDNPYSLLQISGGVRFYLGANQPSTLLDLIEEGSYDYITNFLVLNSQTAFYAGALSPDGFELLERMGKSPELCISCGRTDSFLWFKKNNLEEK